jgi:hypothetical protein
MRTCIGGLSLAALLLIAIRPARADDAKDATAIIDKAIKALGGEEKLDQALKGSTWKGKAKASFGGMDFELTTSGALAGIDRVRTEGEGSFGKFVQVLNGDKGWVSFMDNTMEMEGDMLANAKFNAFIDLAVPFPVLLKGKGIKTEAIGEEKVADKPAVGIKVTAAGGRDFKLYFDKETGIPVKRVAKVARFGPDEFMEEAMFTNYKEANGIKRAMKIESKRDGEKYQDSETTEFKVLDKVDPKTFEKP